MERKSSKNPDENFIGGVKTILTNEKGEYLLIKRNDHGTWDFPGGGVDEGEDTEGAAVRELLEESGIVLANNNLKKASTYAQHDEQKLTTYAGMFSSNTADSETEYSEEYIKNLTSSNEVDAIRWFSIKEILRMRRNEVGDLDGERITWGSFKPFINHLYKSANKNLSDLDEENLSILSKEFNRKYGPETYLGKDSEKIRKESKKPFSLK